MSEGPAFDPYALLDHPALAKAPGVHDGKRTEPCLCTRDDSGSSHDSQHPGEYENDYGEWETCGWCSGQAFRYADCTRCGVGAEPADRPTDDHLRNLLQLAFEHVPDDCPYYDEIQSALDTPRAAG